MNDEQPNHNTADGIEELHTHSPQTADSDEPQKATLPLNDPDEDWDEDDERFSDDTFDDVDEPYSHPYSPTDGYSTKVRVLYQFIIDGLSAQLSILCKQIEREPKNIDLHFQRAAIYVILDQWEGVLHEAEEIARYADGIMVASANTILPLQTSHNLLRSIQMTQRPTQYGPPCAPNNPIGKG